MPAVRARTGQFAGFAPLRSALHSYRTFITRGRYLLTGAALLNVECGKWNLELLSHSASLRRSASAVNSRRSRHFVPLCTHTEHSLLAVFTLLTGAALTVMYCKYIPCVTIISGTPIAGYKLPHGCRVSGANDYVN